MIVGVPDVAEIVTGLIVYLYLKAQLLKALFKQSATVKAHFIVLRPSHWAVPHVQSIVCYEEVPEKANIWDDEFLSETACFLFLQGCTFE